MSDDEVESFEITDYDLDNEFNINRPRRKLTKQQQMLGVWADDSDEEQPTSGQSKSFNKGPKNYTAPVNFVAGGIQQSGKSEEKKADNKDDDGKDDDGDEDDGDDDNGGGGDDDNDNDDDDDDDDDDGDDDTRRARRGDNDYVPNSSSDSEEETRNNERARASFSSDAHGDIAGMRRKGGRINPALIKSGVGGWEVHTRGIGAKLLLRMGFEPGKGLGKKLQGISAPVEAHLRRGRGAIGAYGPEKLAKIPEKKKDEGAEETKEFKEKLSQWRKGGEAATTANANNNAAKRKVRYHYRSVDQVLEDGKTMGKRRVGASGDMSRVKVIDMTGPEQRVLSGYHAIASGQKRLDAAASLALVDKRTSGYFELPELRHNLNLLVDMCERNIVQNDRRTRNLSDRAVALEAERKNITKAVGQQEQLIDTLENVVSIVEKLLDRNDSVGLKESAEAFKKLQNDYYEEYKLYELGDLASTFVAPKLKDSLATWNPLVRPNDPIGLIKEWKDILEVGSSALHSRDTRPYDQLIWNAWMPSIRGAIQEWTCRQPEPLIQLMEDWMPLLPVWIFENILDLAVLPKLTLEVEEWNPQTDTVPIHTWIHPWLPIMRNRMDTLIYPIIRRKLGSALGSWHPSDRTARLILQPWSQVFSKADMEAFLVKNILPKLQLTLSEFVINPHQQYLDQWNWVYEWATLLPIQIMVGLLDKYFFPKWLQVLALWLNHSPNYDQITNWYMGWKGMLNNKLLAEPVVKDYFKKALDMMNRAVSAPQTHQPGAMEQVSYLTSLERTQATVSQIPATAQPRIERLAEAVRTASQIPQGFKDLVQKKCEERGILFMPIPNRYREAKQVYKVGNVQAYIEGNVLFVCHNGTNWVPTHLNALLDTSET